MFSPRAGGRYVNSDSAHYRPLRFQLELTGFGPGRGRPDLHGTMGSVCVCPKSQSQNTFSFPNNTLRTMYAREAEFQNALTLTPYSYFHAQTPSNED